jgi:hypothetical protein
MSIPRDGFLIGLIPPFFKPLLAPLITWPGRNDCNAGIQACIPLVQERLQKYQKKKAEPDYDWLPPVSDASNHEGSVSNHQLKAYLGRNR